MKKLLSLFSAVLLGMVAVYGLAVTGGQETKKPAPARAASLNYGSLYGSIYKTTNLWGDYDIGLYTFPTSGSGEVNTIYTGSASFRTAFINDGNYYGLGVQSSNNSPSYSLFDLETGKKIGQDYRPTETPRLYTNFGIDKDPVTENIYGIFYENTYTTDETVCLAKVTFDGITPTLEKIATINANKWYGLSINSKGEMYGFSAESGKNVFLYKIAIDGNKVELTQIGDTGYKPQNGEYGDCTLDRGTNTLYWAINAEVSYQAISYLMTVDLTTGQATPYYTFDEGEKLGGLAFLGAPYSGDAPAACQAVTADFTNGALNGNINLTTPSTFFNGEAGSGEMTINVTVDGENVGTTTTSEWGKAISIPVTMQKAGEYTFVVTAGNEAGVGEAVEITLFVGEDTYDAPVVTLVFDFNENKLNLSWTLEGTHGGWIDSDAITYNITRYPGAVQLQTGFKGNEFSESYEPTAGAKVYYEVVAVKNGVSSPVGKSNEISFDYIDQYPHTDTYLYQDRDKFDGYTIIDANNDGTTWGWDSNSSRQDGIVCSYNSTNTTIAMDDWFITKGHKLEAGKTYRFSFKVRCNNDSYPERIEVKYGSAPTISAMGKVVINKIDVDWETYDDSEAPEGKITPETTGIYYIGFHGCSDEDQSRLILGGYTIEELSAEDVDGIVPPYESNFASTGMKGYTVIDADNDGRASDHKWVYDPDKGMLVDDWNSAKDDWLITPAFYLEEGKTYNLTSIFRTDTKNDEIVELKLGESADVAAMVISINDEPATINSRDEDYSLSCKFSVASTGTYYIGYHAITAKGMGALILKSYSIDVEEVEEAYYPAPVEVLGSQKDDHFLIFWSEPEFGVAMAIASNATPSVTKDQLVGYNVYRNDELKTTDGHTTELQYKDKEYVVEAQSHKYGVTAVYSVDGNLVESEPTEAVFSVVTSVGSISGEVSVDTFDSSIMICNADNLDINILSANGVSVYRGKGAMQTVVRVQPGMYIVAVADKAYKLLVK